MRRRDRKCHQNETAPVHIIRPSDGYGHTTSGREKDWNHLKNWNNVLHVEEERRQRPYIVLNFDTSSMLPFTLEIGSMGDRPPSGEAMSTSYPASVKRQYGAAASSRA